MIFFWNEQIVAKIWDMNDNAFHENKMGWRGENSGSPLDLDFKRLFCLTDSDSHLVDFKGENFYVLMTFMLEYWNEQAVY
jgi:hypothetical protein